MPGSMKLGLFSMNTDACSFPEGLATIAPLAEDVGFESLWVGEHMVLPDPQRPPSPMAPADRILDPIVTLAFAAALTTRLKLATGILILPQRNPVALAKELASLDVLSGGRLIVGVGVGYLEPEMTAVGVPMAGRGERTAEYIEAMRALWSMDKPNYAGRYVAFDGVDAHPRPVQQPAPRIVMGGHVPASYRRTVELADGWYGFFLTPEQTAAHIDGIRKASGTFARGTGLAPEIEISVTPRGALTAEMIAAFAALGVHRLVVMPPQRLSLDDLSSFVRVTAAIGVRR